MKNRKIIGIFGIALILALLFAALPALPVLAATYDFTLYPLQGKIGDTVTVNGDWSATSSERWAVIYLSPNNLNVGAALSSAPSYMQMTGNTLVPDTTNDPNNAGQFSTTFVIPSTITTSTDIEIGGTVAHTVTPGTYYVYVTDVTSAGNSGIVRFKATFAIVAASLDPLDPASGPPGTSNVLVTGSNFPASTALVFQFDTTTIIPTTGHTSTQSGGTFYSFITIPATATAGAHTITVTAGGSSASAFFTVTGTTTPPPTTPPPGSASIILDPTFGNVNTTISISGSGFIANHAISITYDAVVVKETTSTGTGTFLTSFLAPGGHHGVRLVIASDGTTPASANFTMETDAPFVPQPTRPYMGEGISSPFNFDWGDVADNSTPVTYSLQIATSGNFTTDTIVVDKTNISVSQYTLTQTDELKLSQGITYYWRIKSIDAALNESLWSGASTFSLSQGFSFSGWPLYLTIVLGAILLFLFGIWVGRKTAFNY